jgi:hypothetical protein
MEDLIERPTEAGTALAAPAAAVTQHQLITLDPAKYVAEVFKPYRSTLDKLKLEADLLHFEDRKMFDGPHKYVDISTAAGMAIAVQYRAAFRDDVRISGEKTRKERKAPILEIGKLLDSEYKELVAEAAPYEAKFDEAIKAEDARKERIKQAKLEAEKARLDKLRAIINEVRALPGQAVGKTSAEIAALAAVLTPQRDLTELEDLAGEYCAARADVLGQLAKAEDAARAAEDAAEAQRQEAARLAAERAELAKLRAEAEARQRAAAAEAERVANEQAAEAKRLADQAAAIEQAARKQREAAEANARAEAEAQARAAAEAQRKLDEQAAQIAADRKALEDEKAEQARQTQLAIQRDADHAEALAMNAEFDAAQLAQRAVEHAEALVMDAEFDAERARRQPATPPEVLADSADQMLANEAWPEDSELLQSIRSMFMVEWGMDAQQADARMARFDYAAARAELEAIPA